MATLTVHGLEDDLLNRLADRAAARGRMAEDEARELLERALPEPGRVDRQDNATPVGPVVTDAMRAAADPDGPRLSRTELADLLEAFVLSQLQRSGPTVVELLREVRSERLKRLTGFGLDDV